MCSREKCKNICQFGSRSKLIHARNIQSFQRRYIQYGQVHTSSVQNSWLHWFPKATHASSEVMFHVSQLRFSKKTFCRQNFCLFTPRARNITPRFHATLPKYTFSKFQSFQIAFPKVWIISIVFIHVACASAFWSIHHFRISTCLPSYLT
jgi:hypothetical protein